jgi:hypothetical protein
MFTVLKTACVTIFALALLANFIPMPEWLASGAQTAAIILLFVHLIEVFFFWRYVKMWQGPLVGSIALTLLFGILYWNPVYAFTDSCWIPELAS